LIKDYISTTKCLAVYESPLIDVISIGALFDQLLPGPIFFFDLVAPWLRSEQYPVNRHVGGKQVMRTCKAGRYLSLIGVHLRGQPAIYQTSACAS
jgi:hypothetical protein